jgi:hypothetical protein
MKSPQGYDNASLEKDVCKEENRPIAEPDNP